MKYIHFVGYPPELYDLENDPEEQDDNETVKRKHTQRMRDFHRKGTLWTSIERIIETPLFVDSQLTSMVQIADLCSYSLRQFVEKGETTLFNKIYARAIDITDGW